MKNYTILHYKPPHHVTQGHSTLYHSKPLYTTPHHTTQPTIICRCKRKPHTSLSEGLLTPYHCPLYPPFSLLPLTLPNLLTYPLSLSRCYPNFTPILLLLTPFSPSYLNFLVMLFPPNYFCFCHPFPPVFPRCAHHLNSFPPHYNSICSLLPLHNPHLPPSFLIFLSLLLTFSLP